MLTHENTARELLSFASTDKYLNKMHHVLLAMDEKEEMLHVDGCIIEKKNIMKWLLDLG